MSEGQQGEPASTEDGPRPLGSGRTFGKYETFASLGSGGMADVYLAVARGPKGFQKLVVIKTLKREFSREAAFVEMFLDEARLAAKLNHPNVVHTQEVGESEDGAYYMAMEFLEGQPFNRLIDHLGTSGEAFRPELVARMISDALAGLHYAHELCDYDGHPLSIIHRDISPQNLFVTYEGQVKVVDFGIAKAASSSIQTEVGVLKGKLAYMAPEQAMGDAIDRRADLYAMGIVLWEGLTLRPLARGESAPSRLARILNNDVPRVASVIKDFDPLLDDIVTKALDRDPADRFQTAAEMRDALEGWIARSGTLVRQEEIGRRVSEMFKDARADVQRKVKAQMSALGGLEARTSVLPPESAAPPMAKERCSAMNSSATVALASQRDMRAPSHAAGPPRSRRKGAILAAAAGVVLALGGTALWWGARARGSDPLRTTATTEGGASSSAHGVALTDFPPPKTDNPSAAAAYADALRGLRDGNVATAEAELRSAVEFDPRMGAAYLRLGLLERVYSDSGRSWLEKATTLRDQLSDRDRALLRAAQAVRDDEQRAGAEGLAESLPQDPEALLWSASWFWSLDLDASRKALTLYRQAIALDPLFALAYARLADAQSLGSGWSCTNPGDPDLCVGHPEAAIQTADQCLDKVPGSIACLVARADGHSLLGQCDALEKDAKSLLSRAPSAPQGYAYLMVALMNQGASVSALEQLAERHQAAFPEAERTRVRLRNRVRLSLYTGDFPAAERALAELERGESGSTAETNHYAAFIELLVAEEEGATARATAEAQDYYGRMPAWSLDLGKTNARGFALAQLVRAGKITANESRARMDEWARASVARLPGWRQAHRWVMRHAPVETPDEAREAMSVAPSDLLPYYVSLPYFRGALGRILALSGDVEKALPYLKDEAQWCGAPYGYDNVYGASHGLRQMQDRLLLGQALERSNEREVACAQYGIILDRWGRAKPRSVTADKARERARALGCTP